MTAPGDEQAQNGPGAFRDVLDVQLLDDSLLLAARIARAPAQDSASVVAVLLADGKPVVEIAEEARNVDSWEEATAGPLKLGVKQPLERWTLSLEAPGAHVELELEALTAPADLAEPATAAVARAGGLHRYSQLCRARGTVEIGGRSRPVEAMAVRTHRWRPVGEGGRARFLTAATDDAMLLTVAAVQPSDSAAHGEELIAGQTSRAGADAGGEPLPFETVRLSTVFGERGLPLKAGAELFRPGEELPSRLAGVAAGRTATVPGAASSLTLFRFRLDGIRALGSYEIEGGS
jgi:hypothetical protein